MDIREKITAFLEANQILSLATTDGRELSVCNLHYYADENFNLYFVSKPERQHCKNILRREDVAVCIYDPQHFDDTIVSGVQITWTCKEFTVNDGIDHMKKYYEKFPGKYNDEMNEAMTNHDFRSFYKIEPKRIRMIDGHSRDLPHEITL